MKTSLRSAAAIVCMAALAMTPATVGAAPAPLVDCGDKAGVRDDYDRGFYIERFPGLFLDSVSLWMGGPAASRTITLTARAGTFDGPLVGTATTEVDLTPASQEVVFDFGHIVAPRTLVAFSITVAGDVPDHLVGFSAGGYSSGDEITDCPVVETSDTSPPLSEFRRPGIAIVITGEEPAAHVILPMLASDIAK